MRIPWAPRSSAGAPPDGQANGATPVRDPKAWRALAIGAAATALGKLVPPHAPPPGRSVRRVLVVKPASLGDVILAGPAVAVLRGAFPHARLALAAGRWSLPAARGLPGIDEVLDLGSFGTPGRFGIRDLPGAVRQLRRGAYDLAVVLDRSPLVAVAPLIAGIRWRAGIDSAGRGFAHGIRVRWERRVHEADLYLDVARAAAAGAVGPATPLAPRLEFDPGSRARAAAEALWHGAGLDSAGGPVIVIHPGGGANPGMTLDAKRWPADRFGAVARALSGHGMRVALVGHASDAPAVAATRAAAGVPLVDLSGRPDFPTLAALVGRADAYLGNDSAPLHLAVAMGTPAVALYGPTDPRSYGPYAPPGASAAVRAEAVVSPRACSQSRPFRPGPLEACAGCRCIDAIAVPDVVAAALRVAGRRDVRPA